MTQSTSTKRGLLPSLANRLFDGENFLSPRLWDFNKDFFELDFTSSIPSVNIVENHKDFKIEMAVPGHEKKDFKVEVDNGVLTISSEKEEESKEEKENYTRREFSYKSFSRSFRLPENCVADQIDARYENGILFLSIPKKEVTPAQAPKEIKVF